ncbi:hypothetical protein QWJ06_04020 [Kocuria rhizophila]|uniref:Uncharacterized protein n=1 Tax=Kocuria rhizophila TaxID=72000 RepID=A0AAX2SG13_KOCRH|nr:MULTISPECIES: hypothetical protein [Kocuria]MXN62404.1 hypothetical protein [Bacillus sp. BGMRC0062]WIW68024.1 hypothetical protein P8S73_10130 [Kocuria sp. ChxB]KIC70172.1 hypothetical protein RK09_02375 [Kocuria rhizophila]KMK74249.1 hypothetical protein ACJ65_00730 [Kocuria rhizophila]KUP28280.1 hypothetical protein IX41_02015 [Kocuria rhizophila]
MNSTAQRPSHGTDAGTESREQWVDVTVRADVAHQLVSLTGADGHERSFRTEDVRELALATQHTRGRGQWCAKYRRLLVPGASRVTGGMPFFKLEPLPA